MSQPTVSFRISQNAETLTETVHALSQRLVSMEQRLAGMEENLESHRSERSASEEGDLEQMDHLDNVERLLRDCRELLETEVHADQQEPSNPCSDLMGTISPVHAATDTFSTAEEVASVSLQMDDDGDLQESGEEEQSMAA